MERGAPKALSGGRVGARSATAAPPRQSAPTGAAHGGGHLMTVARVTSGDAEFFRRVGLL
jgi:hypothetical protein